jgi:nucleoside-diphosphate-sugar epimerase
MAVESDLHVVVGAGPLGLAVARGLSGRGLATRVVNRSGQAPVADGVEVVAADATSGSALAQACARATVLYHCAKPPYTNWPQLFPALTRGILDAAASAGAKLVYGDNVYMYGPVDGQITEDCPTRPVGAKGRVRAEMAELLLEAHASGRARVAIGRAPDFYGPSAREAVLGERVAVPALKGGTAEVLGNIDLPHTHIFIDDFARGLITLGEREEAFGEAWHVPGAPTRTTRELADMIFAVAGTTPKYRAASRLIVNVFGLFSPVMRELRETFYQFERPFIVDHSKFERAFGARTTPHEAAIRQTVDWFRSAAAANR